MEFPSILNFLLYRRIQNFSELGGINLSRDQRDTAIADRCDRTETLIRIEF